MDSINLRNQQQVRLLCSKQISGDSYENLQRLASTLVSRCSTRMTQTTNASCSSQTASPARHTCGGGAIDSAVSLRSLALSRRHLLSQMDPSPLATQRAYNAAPSANNSSTWLSFSGSSLNTQSQLGGIPGAMDSGEHLPTCKCLTAIPEAAGESAIGGNSDNAIQQRAEQNFFVDRLQRCCVSSSSSTNTKYTTTQAPLGNGAPRNNRTISRPPLLLEFSLSSVGRSFIDESDVAAVIADSANVSLTTPDTPTPNISPTTSQQCNSDGFSNDFVPLGSIKTQEPAGAAATASNHDIPLAQFGGSWDLLELDLNLHEVNLDPCYDTDVEECIFLGDEREHDNDDDDDDDFAEEIDVNVVVDDPFGVLPTKPTPPDSLDL